MRLGILTGSRLISAVVVAATIAACSGGEDNGTEPTPVIEIALSANTLTLVQGDNGTVSVTLTRSVGFTGPVTVSVEGLPTGVTTVAAPTPIPSGSTTSVITITTAAATTPGNYNLTVRATGTGVTDKTATLQLTVNAAPAVGYTMAVAPTSVTVPQGGNNTATITLTRTGGFTGAVALAASGLSNGVTAAFNPQSVTLNTSTLTLNATGTATVGQATVTITGTATGIANRTMTLTVNVTGTGGGTGNTIWEFCTTADMPIWLAVQDGTGAWTRVTPTATRFQFNIASARGGVAFVTPTTGAMIASQRTLAARMSAAIETTLLMRNKAAEVSANRYAARSAARASSLVGGFDLSIFYGTQAELNSQGTSQCLAGSGKTVNGTVANVAASQTASFSLGDAFESVAGGTTNFTLTGVADGALDLVASRGEFNINTFQTTVDKLIVRRAINAANNSTLSVLDFNATEAFAPAEANITVANLGTDVPIVSTSYFTSSGTTGASIFSGVETGVGPYKYYGVPTARQIAGDLHFAFVIAMPPGETADNARLHGLFFKNPTDRGMTLGAVLPMQTVSVASTTPYVRLRATGSVTADYNKYVQVLYMQGSTTVARDVSISASAGYLSNATTYDFTIPDFSGVAGWNNNWGLKTGVETEWNVSGVGFTGIGVSSPNPVEGATMQGAVRFGTITP